MAGFSARKGRNFNTTPSGINEVSGKDRDFHTIENAPGPGAMATGGIIIEPGDGYVYHVFTGDENFEPLVPSNQLKYVEYMLIGGGGGGASGGAQPADYAGGGGGGGGFVRGYASVTAGNTYPLVIGAGGQYANSFPPYNASGTLGSPTSGFGQVAIGGGGGKASVPNPYEPVNNLLGASGGGGGFDFPTAGGGNLGNNADFDNPLSPEKGWQGHKGGESDTTAPSTYASGPPYTVNVNNEYAGAGGGAGGPATKPAVPFFPASAIADSYRLSAEYTRGPGKQVAEFSVANIGPAYPPSVAARLASPEINGWGAGGGANTTLTPHPDRVTDSPNNKEFKSLVGANSGAGGVGMPGVSPSYLSQVFDPSAYGDSGVAVIRYKKNESGSLAARATGGNVIEPGNNANHFGMVRHIFTGPGTFTVTDPTLTSVRFLAVGGGGGGGVAPAPPYAPNPYARYGAGGGGAGGFVTSETGPMTAEGFHSFGNYERSAKLGKPYVVSSSETGGYPIVIGSGASPQPNDSRSGFPGGDTTIGAPGPEQIIAFGGGGGAGLYAYGPGTGNGLQGSYMEGEPGGSGGGGCVGYLWADSGSVAYGGVAKTAGTGDEHSQGNPGYKGTTGYTPNNNYGTGGGGGGAGGNQNGVQGNRTQNSYHGGWGMWSPLAPPNYGTPGPEPGKRYFAGGGGGAGASGYINPPTGVTPEPYQFSPTAWDLFIASAVGGYGGGGTGGLGATNGSTNTGGGGGGHYGTPPSGPGGSSGGPGIVIIEYPA